MYTDNKYIFKVLGIALLLTFAFAFYDAFVIMFCWNKVMPVVAGFPMVNYWAAFGVGLFIDLFKISVSSADKNKESDTISSVITKVLVRLILESTILGAVALVSLGF